MKTKWNKLAALLMALLMTLSLFTACGGNGQTPSSEPPAADDSKEQTPDEPDSSAEPAPVSDDDVDGELIVDHKEELQYAQFFTMTHYKGGYISFKILGGDEENWTYLVVPEDKSVPAGLGEEYVILQQPIDKVRVDSGTAAIVNAFGGLDHVTAINTEASSIAVEDVANRMDAGDIVYTGSYKEPDYESITAAGIQLVIDTNMLDSNPEVKEKYIELGIPFIVIRTSKEVHPLGYSEWAKVYGAILGMWDEASAYYDAQIKKVNAVTTGEDLGKTAAIVYFSTDGTKVYARRGGDHYAKMVELAGGEYIMKDFEPEETGVGTITMEDFYALCKDADYLINLNLAAHLYTIDELLENAPFMEDFKSVKDGNVYIARDRINQNKFENAGMIADMNTILMDNTVKTTTYFSKAE